MFSLLGNPMSIYFCIVCLLGTHGRLLCSGGSRYGPGLSLVDLANWWFGNSFRNLERYIWEVTFFATLWSLWLARNDLIFNNVIRSASEVGDLVKTRVAL